MITVTGCVLSYHLLIIFQKAVQAMNRYVEVETCIEVCVICVMKQYTVM